MGEREEREEKRRKEERKEKEEAVVFYSAFGFEGTRPLFAKRGAAGGWTQWGTVGNFTQV